MTGGTTTTSTRRLKADMTPQWQRFQQSIVMPTLGQKNKTPKHQNLAETIHPYQRQYSHVYQQRLRVLKPKCLQTFQEKNVSGDIQQVNRILELQEDRMSVVVGTVIECHSFDNDTGDSSKETEFVLEDESGRVTLLLEDNNNNNNKNNNNNNNNNNSKYWWCTGMVVAVQGCVLSDRVGMFRVDAQFMPKTTLPPQLLPKASSSSSPQEPQIMLVSGFQFGSPHVSSLPRDMLLSYLQGHLGTESAKTITRVIICGGNCCSEDGSHKLEALKELDLFVSQLLACGIPVDVMPGAEDPTTANWPQRPLHSSLFTHASTFSTPSFCRTPNPYMSSFSLEEDQQPKIQIVGTDGTNMKDLVSRHDKKMQPQKDAEKDEGIATTKPLTELQALCHTLECHHVCPTGPDSVPTVPHELEDPMVISEKHPHLYFGGNAQQGFDTALWENQVRVVCVPSFATTQQVCTVNLHTLEVQVLQFDDN